MSFEMFNTSVEKRVLGSNPKDAIGSTKVSLTKLPMAGVIHGAHGMMDGADKYGPFNWRENKVIASIYVDAAMRHLAAWFEGQETAEDSEVHHLGHAIACCSILLDAQETGNLIDDRPVFGDPDVVDRLLKRIAEIVKRRKQAKKVEDPLTTLRNIAEKAEAKSPNLSPIYPGKDVVFLSDQQNDAYLTGTKTNA